MGYLHVYTGDGKGKTTAALGLAMRALGSGKKVAIVFFDKGGTDYGERKVLDKLKEGIDYWGTGINRVEDDGIFRFGVTLQDREEGRRALEIAQRIVKNKKYDLLILDEINSSLDLGMVGLKDVLRLIRKKPVKLEIICTGRNCPSELIDQADLVTEMVLCKHYFEKGVPAREGIEY